MGGLYPPVPAEEGGGAAFRRHAQACVQPGVSASGVALGEERGGVPHSHCKYQVEIAVRYVVGNIQSNGH